MYECRIEKDSITQYGERLTTFVVTLPRIVLAELNTHRVFTRSSASSRAIPVEKQIARLREDPFVPEYWGKNEKGMQAGQELAPDEVARAIHIWHAYKEQAITGATLLKELGVHKQLTNRLLEPFMWHAVIITATEWSNFFHLRPHPMAQPEIQKPARMMKEAYEASRPLLLTDPDQWHLPFVHPDEHCGEGELIDDPGNRFSAVKVSVGRSARVSYLNHDGQRSLSADVELAERCLSSGHMAPFEHAARPMTSGERELFRRGIYKPRASSEPLSGDKPEWFYTGKDSHFAGNFDGWIQARKLIHSEDDMLAVQRG